MRRFWDNLTAKVAEVIAAVRARGPRMLSIAKFLGVVMLLSFSFIIGFWLGEQITSLWFDGFFNARFFFFLLAFSVAMAFAALWYKRFKLFGIAIGVALVLAGYLLATTDTDKYRRYRALIPPMSMPAQENHEVAEKVLPKSKTDSPVKSAKRRKADEPKVIHRVYVQSPEMHWEPHPGYYEDRQWYAWAASSSETREACRDSSECQRAMRRLREFGCLTPDNSLLGRCTGRW